MTPTPELAITYSYDALGRTIGQVNPKIGATTKSYDSSTGQLLSEGDTIETVNYTYYPSTDPSAGKLKSRTDRRLYAAPVSTFDTVGIGVRWRAGRANAVVQGKC